MTEIFNKFISIAVPIVLVFLGIIWPIVFEIKATFREERKENARQFLHNFQLEGIKKILNSLDDISRLLYRMNSVALSSCRYVEVDGHERYCILVDGHHVFEDYAGNNSDEIISLSQDVSEKLNDTDIYIDFFPVLKKRIPEIKVFFNNYNSILSEMFEDRILRSEILTESVLEMDRCMIELRTDLIELYNKDINELKKITNTQSPENSKWYHVFKRKK